jgi:hypothetical protein
MYVPTILCCDAEECERDGNCIGNGKICPYLRVKGRNSDNSGEEE